MSVSEREIEPSTLPQGIGRTTAAYTLFIAVDPMLFWQVIGHFCSHIDGVDLSSNVVLGVGAVIGIVTALNFIWFPLLLLDGRTPVAVAAFRKLCILIGPLHILLVTILLVNAAAVGFGEDGLITPVAFVAIPATPLLYFLVKPLFTMKWLDLTAPPESWGKLIGLDGSGRRSIAARGGQPSSMLVAVLLPPLACLRARFYWRAGIAGVVWLFGVVLILAGSFDAVLPFVAAAALGRQVGLAGRVVPNDRAQLSSGERLIRLRQIFTAERLKPPPFALATGFIVTSLKPADVAGQYLYEAIYCSRGEMENRIKECPLDLFADRTSAATMRTNQLRLWFASMAYVLICGLRRIGLVHTQFAQATCGTIRLKLLKIGAQVTRSVRRVRIAMASAHPWQYEFGLAHTLLVNAGA